MDNSVTNIFGKKVELFTEYDNQPERDPVILGVNISKPVCLYVKDREHDVRLLHGAYYDIDEGRWYHRGYAVEGALIVYWHYEDDFIDL